MLRALALVLLLSTPALADPSPLQRSGVLIESTTREAAGLEAPLDALIASARAVAETGGTRDPVLLLYRDADVLDRRASALAIKADALAKAIADLAKTLE